MVTDDVDVSMDFALHRLGAGRWAVVGEAPDQEPLREAMGRMVDAGDGDGARLVRRTTWHAYEYTAQTVLAKWIRPGSSEPEVWVPTNTQDNETLICNTDDDLLLDQVRVIGLFFLSKFLDDNLLTYIELLHNAQAANLVINSARALRSAIQRVAVHQVQGTARPLATRIKELDELVHRRVLRLTKDVNVAVTELRPGKFTEAMEEIEKKFPNEIEYQQYRAITNYLSAGKTWSQKAEMLFQLFEPHQESRHRRLIDRLGEELLLNASAINEVLVTPGRRRVDRMIAMADMMRGNFQRPVDELPIGLRAFGKLMIEGGMPRCRHALHHRLLQEITLKQNFTNEGSLDQEMSALNELVRHIETELPELGHELDYISSVSERIERLLNMGQLNDYLQRAKSASEKLDRMFNLAHIVPIAYGRQRIAAQIQTWLRSEDLQRELFYPQKDKVAGIVSLINLAGRAMAAGFDTAVEGELVRVFDGLLADAVRDDLVRARSSPIERLQRILKVYTSPPLPPGMARRLVSEVARASLASPELARNYASRFPKETDRAEAMSKVKGALRAAGLLGTEG